MNGEFDSTDDETKKYWDEKFKRYAGRISKENCKTHSVNAQWDMISGITDPEIEDQGVHFRHGVADGRSRCENHAAPASHFIQITTLAEHIAGLLCFGGRKASNIAHLGVKI